MKAGPFGGPPFSSPITLAGATSSRTAVLTGQDRPASLERFSPNVGGVGFCLDPDFIPNSSPGRINKRMVRAGPRSRGPRSPREQTPIREAPKRARHTIVNYE